MLETEAKVDGLLQSWRGNWGTGLEGAEGEMKICSWPTCLHHWSGLWVPRANLIFLKPKIVQ